MATIRMRVMFYFVAVTGCSTTQIDRSPSHVASTNIKLIVHEKLDRSKIEREFQSQEFQDVKVCGELILGKTDFFVYSQCKHSDLESFKGVSKIPSEILLPEAQRSIWSNWMNIASSKSVATKKDLVPFVCFVGRGSGDPCDKKNGSLIQRVRRFTTDEQQFNFW